jgi:hypothetical protein
MARWNGITQADSDADVFGQRSEPTEPCAFKQVPGDAERD